MRLWPLRARGGGSTTLATGRLDLLPITPALLQSEAQDAEHLGHALGIQLPPDWPPDLWDPPVRAHIVAQLATQPETSGWHRYIVLRAPGRPLLVGCLGAFPCSAGDVELGYSVATSCQRQGYATEAVDALSTWLLRQAAVHSVSAQAYTTSPASVRVMERCGMRFVGAGEWPGTVRYRRWQ